MIRHLPPTYRLLFLAVGYMALVALLHAVVLPSPTYLAHPNLLGAALLFDLTVWPLLAFWWWVARPQQWSAGRVGLVGVGLLRLAMGWLPNVPASGLRLVLLGTLEIGVVGVTLWRIRTITHTYRHLRRTHDRDAALSGGLAAVFGQRIARIMLSELSVVRYALFSWRTATDVPAGAVPLTTHQQSGQLALLWAVVAISVIELVAMHLLLMRWSAMVAVWGTLLSGYGLLMIIAVIRSIKIRPTYLTADALHLRLDLRWQATIPLTYLASVTVIHDKLPKQPDLLNGALLTPPNVLLTFREPITISGLYGLERQVMRLTLFADEPRLLLNLAV